MSSIMLCFILAVVKCLVNAKVLKKDDVVKHFDEARETIKQNSPFKVGDTVVLKFLGRYEDDGSKEEKQ